jgi:hypothetical protein
MVPDGRLGDHLHRARLAAIPGRRSGHSRQLSGRGRYFFLTVFTDGSSVRWRTDGSASAMYTSLGIRVWGSRSLAGPPQSIR